MRASSRASLSPTLACTLCAFAGSLQAQESILLRFRPAQATAVHLLTWTEGVVTLGELVAGETEGVLTDTVSFEISALHSVTERILESDEGRFVIERTLDSARGRARPVGGAWTAIPPERLPTASARAVVSSRLQTVEFRPSEEDTLAPSGAAWLLRNPGLGVEFVLPDERVTPGSDWSAEMVARFDPIIDWQRESGAFAERTELVGQAKVTLERLEVRGPDTLAYLEFRGTFLPVALTDAREIAVRTATITGGFAGQLIWSTAWSRFVSGANRLGVFVRSALPEADPSGVEVGMRFDMVSRFQVRP
ncbi:MAG: hypothetical protein ACE5PT_02890 [Gemmatimonadales bacterium]